MVTLRSEQEVTEVPLQSGLNDEKVAEWFYRVPCAGVTYYSFEERPPRPEKVELQSSDETTDSVR